MGLGMELSPVVVRDMQLMAAALLRAGGFAVHVGSSGVVHTAEKWWQLSESNLTFDIYRSFVRLAVEPKYYYTCGMHNFGLPDSRIPRSGKPELAGEILNNFNLWRINQNPDLNAGETFSVNGVPGAFRLGKDFVGAFKPGEPFFNPFGIWTLEPVTQH
jgi:hypothetical protein